MKKTFVKYFGVASATVLAAAPVVTPALMTASNLQVVKADILQDNITAAFKADNSIVPLSDEAWQSLTNSNYPNYSVDGVPTSEAPKDEEFLEDLEANAKNARDDLKQQIIKEWTDFNDATSINSAAARGFFNAGSTGLASSGNAASGSAVVGRADNIKVKSYSIEDGKKTDIDKDFRGWMQIFDPSGTHKDTSEPGIDPTIIFPNDLFDALGEAKPDDLTSRLTSFVNGIPLWYFVNGSASDSTGFIPNEATTSIHNGKINTFKPIKSSDSDTTDSNGLVTVAPNGGTKDVSKPSDPSLSYVVDDLTYLQKYTDNELLNLVPSVNTGKNKAGTPFSNIKGRFNGPEGRVTASRSAKQGSKVWSEILGAVLNPKDKMFPLKDMTTTNITNTRMIVNGKESVKE